MLTQCPVKQVIVMRTDTDPPMRKGKMVAQGAHAACSFMIWRYFSKGCEFTSLMRQWMATNHRKICVRVDSLQELNDIVAKAREAGIEAHVITDDGLTEFKEKTVTCAALGPDEDEKLNAITGHLKLL